MVIYQRLTCRANLVTSKAATEEIIDRNTIAQFQQMIVESAVERLTIFEQQLAADGEIKYEGKITGHYRAMRFYKYGPYRAALKECDQAAQHLAACIAGVTDKSRPIAFSKIDVYVEPVFMILLDDVIVSIVGLLFLHDRTRLDDCFERSIQPAFIVLYIRLMCSIKMNQAVAVVVTHRSRLQKYVGSLKQMSTTQRCIFQFVVHQTSTYIENRDNL